MAERQIMQTTSEVDRHTDSAIVENRNGTMVNVSTAMCFKAMGENLDVYSPQVGPEVAKWACHCINHTSITPEQKASGKTAYQEQFPRFETRSAEHLVHQLY